MNGTLVIVVEDIYIYIPILELHSNGLVIALLKHRKSDFLKKIQSGCCFCITVISNDKCHHPCHHSPYPQCGTSELLHINRLTKETHHRVSALGVLSKLLAFTVRVLLMGNSKLGERYGVPTSPFPYCLLYRTPVDIDFRVCICYLKNIPPLSSTHWIPIPLDLFLVLFQ